MALPLPVAAWANAGVPMLALAWPLQWLALAPIIVIEALVLAKFLGASLRLVVWPVAKANLISTLVGVPVAWAAMLLLEFLIAGGIVRALPTAITEAPSFQYVLLPFAAAWVGGSSPWEVYAAFVVLAVPFCLVSVYIERRYLSAGFPGELASQVREAVRVGNVLTYGLLVAVALFFPLTA